jgi:hypothetical protein
LCGRQLSTQLEQFLDALALGGVHDLRMNADCI